MVLYVRDLPGHAYSVFFLCRYKLFSILWVRRSVCWWFYPSETWLSKCTVSFFFLCRYKADYESREKYSGTGSATWTGVDCLTGSATWTGVDCLFVFLSLSMLTRKHAASQEKSAVVVLLLWDLAGHVYSLFFFLCWYSLWSILWVQ